MKKVLVIDNYDSFTYNLVHYLENFDCEVTVFRNDEFDLEEIQPFEYIVLSPGPGIPEQAGLLNSVIKEFAASKKILGICLGQQAIAEVFGGNLINLENVFHGVATSISIVDKEELLFKNLKSKIDVGRYHSWVVNETNLPSELVITAVDENHQIMALRHQTFNVRGVQFHPESILTPTGKTILSNWLEFY